MSSQLKRVAVAPLLALGANRVMYLSGATARVSGLAAWQGLTAL